MASKDATAFLSGVCQVQLLSRHCGNAALTSAVCCIDKQALVLKALVGLCTVLYKSFPTTIQADKAFLAEQQQQQQHAADEQRRLEAERLQTAVQFRLGLKLLLEQSSKALLMRLKALLQ